MSVSAPSSPPTLPPAVTVTMTSPRERRLSLRSQSEIALNISRTPSPSSSSSSSHMPRPGILRSASVGNSLYNEARTASPTQGISFAPLPEIAPRKRKSSRALGLAARSEMLRAQAERRQHQQHQQQEQDLAWEDLAQLMKDASNLLKRVVGKAPKKDQQSQQPQQPGSVPQEGPAPGAVHLSLPDEPDAALLDHRPRSPPPPPPSKDDENHRDSGFAEDVDERGSRESTPQPQQ